MMRDRRRHPRIPYKSAAVVTVYPASARGELVGRVLGCTTTEISAGGVRLLLSQRIEPGSRLELRIAAVNPPATFLLRGSAVWTHETVSRNSWMVGVDVDASDDKNLKAWRAFVQGNLPPQAVARPTRAVVRDTQGCVILRNAPPERLGKDASPYPFRGNTDG